MLISCLVLLEQIRIVCYCYIMFYFLHQLRHLNFVQLILYTKTTKYNISLIETIPHSKSPSFIASICQLIVMLNWVRSMGVRKSVTALIYLILIYLRVPHFFNIHVDCGVHTPPNHCNERVYTCSYMSSMISYLFVYCCVLYHPPRSQLYPYHTILYQKSCNQNDVVGCHILVCRHPLLVETDLLYQLIVVLTIVGHCLAALDHSLPIWLF